MAPSKSLRARKIQAIKATPITPKNAAIMLAFIAIIILSIAVVMTQPAEEDTQQEQETNQTTTQEQECPPIIDYVCGEDNKTYANDCLLREAGTTLKHAGKCETQAQEPEQNETEEPEPGLRTSAQFFQGYSDHVPEFKASFDGETISIRSEPDNYGRWGLKFTLPMESYNISFTYKNNATLQSYSPFTLIHFYPYDVSLTIGHIENPLYPCYKYLSEGRGHVILVANASFTQPPQGQYHYWGKSACPQKMEDCDHFEIRGPPPGWQNIELSVDCEGYLTAFIIGDNDIPETHNEWYFKNFSINGEPLIISKLTDMNTEQSITGG